VERLEKKVRKEVERKMDGRMQEIMDTLNRLENDGGGQTEFHARIHVPLVTDVKLYLRLRKSCCTIS